MIDMRSKKGAYYFTILALLSSMLLSAQTWTGSVSSDWNNASNWSGSVPGSYSTPSIPGNVPNQPEITGNVTVKDITIGD